MSYPNYFCDECHNGITNCVCADDQEMNRLAYEALYGDEEAEIERERQYLEDAWWLYEDDEDES